jgi:hypothetical protein
MDLKQEYAATTKAHMKSAFYATKPTPATVFLRTFLPWQIVRFLRINLKMFFIIRRSHRTHPRR